ncbi:hypothetical protein ABTK07_19410, partial [Acinetobacter baumannii]
SKSDPNNAFWLQMLAVFQWHQGARDAAIQSLSKASTCSAWNDLQSKRLGSMQNELRRRYGTDQSWQYGSVYAQRSNAPVASIAFV